MFQRDSLPSWLTLKHAEKAKTIRSENVANNYVAIVTGRKSGFSELQTPALGPSHCWQSSVSRDDDKVGAHVIYFVFFLLCDNVITLIIKESYPDHGETDYSQVVCTAKSKTIKLI